MGFGAPERASGLRVHETSGAPLVMRVDLVDEAGASHAVYSGGDATASGGWLTVRFPTTSYRVAKAKVYTRATGSSAAEIDAVGLDLATETYEYNGFNQLQSVTGADGGQTTFGYDGNGNQTTKSVRTGWVTQTTTYGYDEDNRLRSVSVPSGPPGEATVQWGSSATASSAPIATGLWSPAQATGAPNTDGCTSGGTAWEPDWFQASSPQWLQVEYATPAKAVGVRVHETGGPPSITKVEAIDEAGTAHVVWTGTDTTACGQWFEAGFGETTYKVKALRISTAGPGQEQLDAVGLMMAPPAGPTSTSTYAYDANGLRVRKSDTSGETRYLLDGLSVVAQYAPTGERQAFYVQSLARIDEVLSVVNSVGKFWYQADALGSVYTLTTAAGDVRARGGYDVFGEPVAEYGQQVGQPFGFTGREHELDSGLVYGRARYLNPAAGRWTAPDPYSVGAVAGRLIRAVPGPAPFDIDGRSGYDYPLPVLRSDPTGLWVAGIGLGVGFIIVTGGFELVLYYVVDDKGGMGLLLVPALRVGLGVGGDASIYGFVNFQAESLEDVEGLGVSLNVAIFDFSVGPQVSISKKPTACAPIPNNAPWDLKLLWGVGGSWGLGLTLGIYFSIGYGFLWRWR